MEKRVIAVWLRLLVRRLRPSATSSRLDDCRPADQSTSYHTTAATANTFSWSMSQVAAKEDSAQGKATRVVRVVAVALGSV